MGDERYIPNPFQDYVGGQEVTIDQEHVTNLICNYVDAILESTHPGASASRAEVDTRGDLYVGNAGIAYMFWRMNRSPHMKDIYPAMDHATTYINNAKSNAVRYKKKTDERVAFLLGNAGIYAVSAVISYEVGNEEIYISDMRNFHEGFAACKPIAFTPYGCDEVLVGRAGFLSGCYWLNNVLPTKPISVTNMAEVCGTIVESGFQYAETTKAPLPLMYQYHGTEYLGAAHGLCAILHMLLESPWFKNEAQLDQRTVNKIKASIDFFLSLQDSEGNFPVALEDLRNRREKRLVHWCHGAPGAVYLFAKAYILFKDQKYLNAVIKAGELVWRKGLLKKGPGICHGVAGNGYVFLLLFRLTGDVKYLYRAEKFMRFLTNSEFKQRARIPDRPFSLYEGVAGTVCFLMDLLEPEQASFPFMDVFN